MRPAGSLGLSIVGALWANGLPELRGVDKATEVARLNQTVLAAHDAAIPKVQQAAIDDFLAALQ